MLRKSFVETRSVLNEFYGDERDEEIAGRELEGYDVYFVRRARLPRASNLEININLHVNEFSRIALETVSRCVDLRRVLERIPGWLR